MKSPKGYFSQGRIIHVLPGETVLQALIRNQLFEPSNFEEVGLTVPPGLTIVGERVRRTKVIPTESSALQIPFLPSLLKTLNPKRVQYEDRY